MRITEYDFNFEREELVRPFMFKAGAFSEKWINVSALRTDTGLEKTGIGSTAVLWSDPEVFADYSEAGGNLLMSSLAEYACSLLIGAEFRNPIEALELIRGGLYEQAKRLTRRENLRFTFVLNSLIAPDNTLWKLFSCAQGYSNFADLLEGEFPGVFASKQEYLACIPLITYNVPVGEIKKVVEEGVFFLKIKIGQGGSQEEMLEKDMSRLSEIFMAVGEADTPHTDSGKTAFYLDANGRYETKKMLERLLEHCEKIGMLERILVLEEPFPEEVDEDVSGLPVRIAADESLHGEGAVVKKFERGYKAVALKPAGKTMSMSLLMGKAALDRGMHCYTADSACPPQLVEWNKNLAARLPAFPGLKCGFMESNGAAFYKRWRWLVDDHPGRGAGWVEPERGMFVLDESFYETSGGIFDRPGHYADLVKPVKKGGI